MPFQKIILRPGVNTQQSPLLNEASWSSSNLIRFFQGLLQKIGGWMKLIPNALTGTCRGMLAWADLNGRSYLACGTEQRLQAVVAGVLYDITPLRVTHDVTPTYDTTNLSNVITVTDALHGANANDGVVILNPISVGGLILQGLYTIQTIVDVNNYTVNAASNATSTVLNGGAAALFNVTNGSNVVTVTLNNHGLVMGGIYTVQVSTTVGGIILFGDFIVQSVTNANVFVINGPSSAGSTTSGSENGGNSRLQYLIHSGLASTGVSVGYGIGGYGFGPYGVGGSSSTPLPLRQWSMDAWGQQLLANPNFGSLYYWDPTLGIFQNRAAIIAAAPPVMTGFFIAMPQQQVVAYGATDPGTGNPDPMLIRYCDVANYNQWTASSINQAGSYRLPRGSKIIGGIQGPQYGLLWTDLALWQMQYIQPPLVYGFNEVASGCSLMSQRARGILGTEVYWVSQNGYFRYANGGIQPIPCPVWDIMFQHLLVSQSDKVFIAPDTPFNEFFTFFPSMGGTGEIDSYLKCNVVDGVWDYGNLIRTAWIDQSVLGNPLAVDGNRLIQQHESGSDADGQSIIATATSGWFKLNEGTMFIFIERMLPDFILSSGASVSITVYTADYPEDTPTVYGPYNVTSSTEYIIIRSRSRLARVQISSNADLGTFWRLGEMLYMATPQGRR